MVYHILQVRKGILVKTKELDNKYKKIFDTMTQNENFMEKIDIVFSPMPGIDAVDFCLFPINDKDYLKIENGFSLITQDDKDLPDFAIQLKEENFDEFIKDLKDKYENSYISKFFTKDNEALSAGKYLISFYG